MAVIYIGGVKGVGKTFVLREVFNQLSQCGISYERAKVAEVMFELLKNQGVIEVYDELEEVLTEMKKKIRIQAFQNILANRKRNLIFDGHYAISSAFGYEFGIPLETIEKINHLLLLYNDPGMILERRKKDMSKKRENNLEKVKLDLVIEKEFAEFYAYKIGRELKMIKSDNEASSKLINFLKEVMENG